MTTEGHCFQPWLWALHSISAGQNLAPFNAMCAANITQRLLWAGLRREDLLQVQLEADWWEEALKTPSALPPGGGPGMRAVSVTQLISNFFLQPSGPTTWPTAVCSAHPTFRPSCVRARAVSCRALSCDEYTAWMFQHSPHLT